MPPKARQPRARQKAFERLEQRLLARSAPSSKQSTPAPDEPEVIEPDIEVVQLQAQPTHDHDTRSQTIVGASQLLPPVSAQPAPPASPGKPKQPIKKTGKQDDGLPD